MFHPRLLRLLMSITLIAIGTAPRALVAQESTPSTTTAGMEVVASGLTSPRGIVWGADGTLFVALAGSGGTNEATEDAPTSHAIGPWHGGSTAAVASIDAVGCPVLVSGGLPSSIDSTGGVLGADDLAILGDQLYVSVDGGGPVHGNADQPSGVYRVLADGSYELVADLSDWVRNNPVSELPGDFDPDAAGYSMVADEASGLLWVGDPNSGQILSVSPDGQVNRIADLSTGHPVPTRLVLDPAGGVYVGTLTTVPFPDGTAMVMHVDADGTVADVWTGLTVVTDVAVGADGSLYALEMSTGNLQEPPFLTPGSGQIVHQTGPDSSEVVASGLMFPVAMNMGSDGALYVSMPALGAGEGQGSIVRVSLDGSTAGATSEAGACTPLPETLTAGTPVPAAATPQAADASPAPAVMVTPMPDAEMASPAASMSEPAGTVEIGIANFAYDPAMVEIPAGTTVTWTNNDSTAHTATGMEGEFETGAIQPGASASVTFDTPGTYVYVCQFHPNMQATIVVK